LPTRRFDGPDLDAALARARAEVGNGARVLRAERVRSGGLGGFFAKERVEIEVEVSDSPHAEDDDRGALRPPDLRDDSPSSLLDLVDMVSQAEHRDASAAIRPDRVDAVPPTPVDRDTSPRPLPTISTETSSFAEILQRITTQTDAVPATPVAATPAPPAPAPVTTPTAGADAAPAAARPPARAPMRLVSTPAPRGASCSAPGPAGPGDAAQAAPLAATPMPPPAREPGPLARLGLPPELEPDGPDLRRSLIERLASLPPVAELPSSRGTVVAVVGPRGAAQQIARALCLHVGSDPAAVVTLGTRRRGAADPELISATEVTDNRRAWRRRPVPTVTVVDAPLGRPLAWAAEVLAALEPTAVWGIVEASRKVEDIAAWSAGLGGLDALCLTDLDDTVSPAAPLRTGVPVALLEGEPATPERWADLLLARLAS